MARSQVLSLRKERIVVAPDEKNGFRFGGQGRLIAQVRYSRNVGAPTGKIILEVRADDVSPFVPALDDNNNPMEILTNQLQDRGAEDIFQFDSAFLQFRFVYERDAWTDPYPNDPSVLTNFFQIYWNTI